MHKKIVNFSDLEEWFNRIFAESEGQEEAEAVKVNPNGEGMPLLQ